MLRGWGLQKAEVRVERKVVELAHKLSAGFK